MYTPDISTILMRLELKPGMTIAESGTGSGSLSVSMCKAILPNGHLYTFEFNNDRVIKATSDFQKLGLSNNITVTHRDVLNNGFLLKNEAGESLVNEMSIDAIFLDLPSP